MDAIWKRYCAAIQLITMNDVMITARCADVYLPDIMTHDLATVISEYDQQTRIVRRENTN